jgi:hypothetical protein
VGKIPAPTIFHFARHFQCGGLYHNATFPSSREQGVGVKGKYTLMRLGLEGKKLRGMFTR